MASLTQPAITPLLSSNLRPIDAQRDLAKVADLIELCFANTLDQDGMRYLQHMRTAASAPGLLYFASAAEYWTSLPVSGFVWEEDGRLVGNVSLLPIRPGGKRSYLIANVAVHPDFRNRGIGRLLTRQAVEYTRQRGYPVVWLQVREENEPAVHLYQNLGFIEQARRTTWYSSYSHEPLEKPSNIRVTPSPASLWATHESWIKRTHPPVLYWHLPLKLDAMKPGLVSAWHRIISGTSIQQWSAWLANRPVGVLTCQTGLSPGSLLWLAAEEESEPAAAAALLYHLRSTTSRRRSFVLDYPAHHASPEIEKAGFYIHQTLIWMKIDLD